MNPFNATGHQNLTKAFKLWSISLIALCLNINASGAAALVLPQCLVYEIPCPNKKGCLSSNLDICNGIRDCLDGWDESDALCSTYNCSVPFPDYMGEDEYYNLRFKCPSGKMCTKDAVYYNRPDAPGINFWLCTGKGKECADGSDEDPKYCTNLDCKKQSHIGLYSATCPSKKYCIGKEPEIKNVGEADKLLCDGMKDCPDGSDEWPSFCKIHGCSGEATLSPFRCKDGGCVQTHQICNGIRDCADGSDEAKAFCSTYQCGYDYVKCADNITCYSSESLCDGKKDCPDGSDENPARCHAYECPSGFAKCKDGLQCIEEQARCNNTYECNDKSDESKGMCNQFCPGSLCPSGRGCLPSFEDERLCDGRPDCVDGSDEGKKFCKNFTCEAHGRIKCKDGMCSPPGKICDGFATCNDRSDEDPAFCKSYKCPLGFAKCPNFPYICLPEAYICTGTSTGFCPRPGADDEVYCTTYKCLHGYVKCPNLPSQCVRKDQLCDGTPQCRNGGDEDSARCRPRP